MDNDGKNGCCEGYEYGAYKYMFPRVMLRSAPYMPHIYFNVISDEQRVKDMCEAIDNLYAEIVGYLPVEEFNAFLEKLEIDQAAQTQEAHEYADLQDENLYNKLVEVITKLQIGMLIWDETIGAYNENVQAMRNMFNDVTVHAITVDVLADLPGATVDSISTSGLNVRGLAVFSGWLTGSDFIPDGVWYNDAPIPDQNLTVKILAQGQDTDGFFTAGKEGK